MLTEIFAAAALLLQGVQTYFTIHPRPPAWGRSVKIPRELSPQTVIVMKSSIYALLIPTFALLLITMYLNNERVPKFKNLDYSQMEHVTDQTYVNQVVDIDGKSFRHCTFSNVKLHFAGTASFEFVNNKFYGTRVLQPDNPAVVDALQLIRELKIPDVPITQGE